MPYGLTLQKLFCMDLQQTELGTPPKQQQRRRSVRVVRTELMQIIPCKFYLIVLHLRLALVAWKFKKFYHVTSVDAIAIDVQSNLFHFRRISTIQQRLVRQHSIAFLTTLFILSLDALMLFWHCKHTRWKMLFLYSLGWQPFSQSQKFISVTTNSHFSISMIPWVYQNN